LLAQLGAAAHMNKVRSTLGVHSPA